MAYRDMFLATMETAGSLSSENTRSREINLSSSLLLKLTPTNSQGKLLCSQTNIPSIQQRVSDETGNAQACISWFTLSTITSEGITAGLQYSNVPKHTHQFKILLGEQIPYFMILTFAVQTLSKLLPRPLFKEHSLY